MRPVYDGAMNAMTDISADPLERAEAYQTIAAALDWLQTHADVQPGLAELSARVGLSEFHLQRLFARWAGVSPKRFLQHLSRERARAALLAGEDMLGASMAAGLSGPGRLHDLIVSCETATPGELKSGGAGLSIVWGVVPTPFGPALIAESPRGLVKLAFASGDEDLLIAELMRDWPAADFSRDERRAAVLAARIFSSYRQPEPVHLFVKGTQFQLKVWEALLRVPEGRLTSYGDIATAIGHPRASRAVGTAVGSNPVALLIPCHRVIRRSGVLGHYRWGDTRKQMLVGLELAAQTGSPVL